MFSLMGGISAKGKGPGGITVSQNQQTCADEPCKNGGSCLASEEFNRGFYCRCTEGFTGIYCDIDVPEVKCGESYMEVSLQKQMILEHGLEDNVENIGFKESYALLPKSRGPGFKSPHFRKFKITTKVKNFRLKTLCNICIKCENSLF